MPNLYYFVDPMCSWCYGFSSEMKEIINQLPDDVNLHYVMGGLAPDSDKPMPEETKRYVQHHWHTVAENSGAKFNFDFWTKCEPKRSTYPSCRAVIAARMQGEDYIPIMVKAIQKAYYQQARNPSESETLIEIAGEIGLDKDRFINDFISSGVENLLQADFSFKNRLGVQGFPTLVLEKDDKYYALTIGYTKSDIVMKRFYSVMSDKVKV